ncbi:MAG: phage holin family protein [Bacteroidia bacterium]|nr:phage holin family protein [Bacteroidia bacterium]
MKPKFDTLIQNNATKGSLAYGLGGAIFLIGFMFFVYWGILLGMSFMYVVAAFALLIAVVLFLASWSAARGGARWIDLIENHPEKVVWIKPVVTKHKVALFITAFETNSFSIYAKGGNHLRLECNSEPDQKAFLEMVAEHLPQTHIGYSYEVEKIFNEGSEKFIETLQDKELFRPIGSYGF